MSRLSGEEGTKNDNRLSINFFLFLFSFFFFFTLNCSLCREVEERTRELIVKGEEGRDMDNQSLRQTRVSISNCVSNSFESKRRIFLSPFIIRKGFF